MKKKKIIKGIIISDKMNKTRIILVKKIKKHKKYYKNIYKKKKYFAHDENNITKTGEIVEIIRTKPLSKKKHWIIKLNK